MQKEHFQSLDHPSVKIFICGPTLYDYAHLGHARVILMCDVIARYLKSKGYKPFILLNLTDIDPKVFNQSRRENLDYKSMTRKYNEELKKDLTLFNVENINAIAMAGNYIEHIKKNITKLLEEGYAYSANGNIYFNTMKTGGYGTLSHQSVKEMAIHRIDLAPNKKNHFDFLIWNCRDSFDIYWKSDYGAGIPWWHIQDTTIAICVFQSRYDIHCGAGELLYPHHEAHLAQMKALTKEERPIGYWVHTGILKINGKKMSKSTGNVIFIRDAVIKYGSNALRLYILLKHYREDIIFDENELVAIKGKVTLIHNALHKLKNATQRVEEENMFVDQFYNAMDNDLDTPGAITALIELCEYIVDENITPNKVLKGELDKMLAIIGLIP